MRTLISALPLVVLVACNSSNGAPRENMAPGTRGFSVGAFDRVELAGSDNVRVVRGAALSVVASGPQAVLDRLDIRVEGSTLKVGRKREGWHIGWKDTPSALVTVTIPALRGAAVAGSGDMTVDQADGDAFDAAVAGSGNLALAMLRVGRADLEVAGSGNLTVGGRATDAEIGIAGSGNVDAVRLVSERAEISIAGSGNASLTARQSADVSIAGSGNATVTGTDNCKVSKLGSGEARCSK